MIPTWIDLCRHLDKQPPLEAGWSAGMGPWKPVIQDKDGHPYLYGRGGVDDGYAPFAALLAIKAARAQSTPLPRIVIVLECEEESGSQDLLHLLDAMKVWLHETMPSSPFRVLAKLMDGHSHAQDVIKTPDICICLDAGTATYDALWVTSSLRGMVACNVKAQSIEKGQHSGTSGGIVPETLSGMYPTCPWRAASTVTSGQH